MQSHVIILLLVDTTGTTYTFYEIDEEKDTVKQKTKTKTNRKKEKKKIIIKETNWRVPLPQAMWQTLEKNEP